jgi:cytochrome c peroxidase
MIKPAPENSKATKKQTKLNLGLKALGVAALFSTTSAFAVVPPVPAVEEPGSLKFENVPEPSNLHEFVKNKSAAIALGKALFWELRIGSDGEKACATCHFSGGADTRLKNQLAPAHQFLAFQSKKPNETLELADFPFTKFSDVTKNDKSGSPIRDVRDVAGSAGVFKTQFLDSRPGYIADEEELLEDDVFEVAELSVYQVTPRNTPTMINAIFNLRSFWDGRAQTIFNGVNPFGKRDPQAGIYINQNGVPVKQKVTINDASIASLATGPVLSTVEMSAIGRAWPQVARRVLSLRALEGQEVAANDSVLGQYAQQDGTGGIYYRYDDIIRYVFKDKYWNTNQKVSIGGEQFNQMEANFSLFFGLAVQTYIATLVSDEAPFDKYAEGDSNALTAQEKHGFELFKDKGKCVSCHGGAVFKGTSNTRKSSLGKTERISNMIMGDGQKAIYDEGFYNIGVTRTQDDPGVGGTDPWGNPLSFTRLAKKSISNFYWKELDLPNESVKSTDRDAVQGSFKVPTLRNIELTAPYFHNGGYGTLRQVVEFYNRGGNFPRNNKDNLAPDIEPLGLSDSEIDDIVAFLRSLTDPRVKNHAAPFDHPMVSIADGFTGDENGNGTTEDDELPGAAADIGLDIPAVGRNGYQNVEEVVPTFSKRIGVVDVEPPVAVTPLPEPAPIYRTLVKCGSERGTCDLTNAPKPAVVYYAHHIWDLSRNRSYTGKTGVYENSISCNNATFGDPKPGHRKECYYVK